MVGIQSDMAMFSDGKGKSSKTMPGITPEAVINHAGFRAENYRVRIQRFVVDSESLSDIAMLEGLWSAGMDPSEDGIIILSNKEFTHNDVLIVVVTFLEHKTKTVHWRIGGSDTPPAPTAQDFINEGYKK